MKISTLPALILLMAVFSFAACADTNTSLTGDWQLISYGDASSPTPAISGVDTSVSFGEDGQFGGTVGCNTFGGEYKVNGNQVAFSGVFSTLMFCEGTSDQESAVLAILSDKTLNFSVSGSQLTLSSESGTSVVILEKK